MMSDQMQKAINLAKKTGDRLIVFSRAEAADPFVVMTLDEYEKLAIGRSGVRGLTEDELIDKINRDIAIWKSEQEEAVPPAAGRGEAGREQWPELAEKRPDADFFHIGRIGNIREHRRWSIPKDRKAAAEEVIEEDRQYLEDVF